ncbi:MAG: hypothetical protein ABI361_03070 [Nitrososphaera sp.]|jgi:hypothetical protein
MSRKAQVRMPPTARLGIAILVVGAIIVGIGEYQNIDAMSLYGVIMVGCGFVLYMASSVVARRAIRK